jgi:hypothetical protein
LRPANEDHLRLRDAILEADLKGKHARIKSRKNQHVERASLRPALDLESKDIEQFHEFKRLVDTATAALI